MKRISTGRIVMLLLFCLMQTILFAQGREITGKVTDKNGNPLPGVSIAVKGTTQGTITNVDGNYSITVSDDNAVLVFSYVGYVSEDKPTQGKTQIDVQLQEDIMQLDEIVVTGYGVSKKSDLTGSLSSVKSDDFNKAAASTPDQLIQGRVSGVQIVSNNGEPGAGSQVRVRGLSTIMGGVQPLYVVDGVPLDLRTTSPDGISGTALGGAPATSPLNFIDPSDIASIDILKDASAAAIYGARAANGVVIITTKKGKEGKSQVNYDYKFSISNLPKKLDVLSASDWLRWREDTLGLTQYNYGHSTDWQDQIFRTAYTNSHNLSLSGGTKSTTYRTSFGYLNQQGIIKKSDLTRYSGKLNLSQKALDNKVTFVTNLIASEVVEHRVPVGATGFEGDLLLNALKSNPTWPVYDSTGAPFQTGSTNERNPVAMLQYTNDLTRTTRLMGNLSATLEIIKGLNYKVNLGLDYSNANRFINQSQKLDYMKATNGQGQINNLELYNYLIEHTLNYSKSFGKQTIDVLAGYSYQNFKSHKSNSTAGGFATDGIPYTNQMQSGLSTYNSIYTEADAYKYQSYFGRINYNFNEKYLVTATLREDGSSKFGANNRYGTFPSFAVAWRLSQEGFIQNLNIFNNLKLRIGWGQTGNSEIPTKNSRPIFSPDNGSRAIIGGQQIIGLKLDRTPNPNIKWETTSSTNIGLDYGFFDGRLSGSIDVYNKTTKNILIERPSPAGAPTPWVYDNVDSCHIINNGVDLSLTGAILTKTDLKWTLTANGSFLHNIVKYLPTEQYQTGSAQGQGLTGAYVQVITNNEPLNVFYGLKVDSIASNGNVYYLKKKGSTVDSLTYLGNPQPKFTWSLNNTFTYKNFDLSIFIEGVYGNKIFNNTALLLDKPNLRQASNALTRFVNDNVSFNYIPKVSDRYIENGSYVRLSNVTLGYTLNLKNPKYVKSFRVYASGSNLLLFTKYTGYDPDVSSSKNMNDINSFGIDITNYPKARTFMFGVNVSF